MKDLKITFSFNYFMIIFIILLVLKLLALINIDWIWVFSPLWIPIGGTIIFIISGYLLVYILELIQICARKIKRK